MNCISSNIEEKNIDPREIKEISCNINSSGSKSTQMLLNYKSNNNKEDKKFAHLERLSFMEIKNQKFNGMNRKIQMKNEENQKQFKKLRIKIDALKG